MYKVCQKMRKTQSNTCMGVLLKQRCLQAIFNMSHQTWSLIDKQATIGRNPPFLQQHTSTTTREMNNMRGPFQHSANDLRLPSPAHLNFHTYGSNTSCLASLSLLKTHYNSSTKDELRCEKDMPPYIHTHGLTFNDINKNPDSSSCFSCLLLPPVWDFPLL